MATRKRRATGTKRRATTGTKRRKKTTTASSESTKMIAGKRYILDSCGFTKSGAMSNAKAKRKDGMNARVLPSGTGKYCVYTAKPKSRKSA